MQSQKTEYIVQVLVGSDWVDVGKPHTTMSSALAGSDAEAKCGFYSRVSLRDPLPKPPTGGIRPPVDYPDHSLGFQSDMGEPLTKQEKITALVYVLIVVGLLGLSAWVG